MPLDVLGRTRATLMHSTSVPWPRGLGNLVNVHRDRDRLLQLLILNEELLVNADHQSALITSLPFVHTPPVAPTDVRSGEASGSLPSFLHWEFAARTCLNLI